MNLQVPKVQFPAAGSAQVAGVRTKVALKPGHSLMDWIRLGNSGKDLTGVGGVKQQVLPEELAKHNKQDDAWMAIRGRVYNVTPYMEFHPGGEDELLRGVGKDATLLFDEVHKWVNVQSMLAKCYVGKLTEDIKIKPGNRKASLGSKTSLTANGFVAPPPVFTQAEKPANKETASPKSTPSRHEWYQTDSTVTVVIYTKYKNMCKENVIIDKPGQELNIAVLIQDQTYLVHVELENSVASDYEVKVSRPSGKVEIILKKISAGLQWQGLGKPLKGHATLGKTDDRETVYRDCKVLSIEPVSHDTNLYCLGLPEGSHMCVPLGFHVHLQADVDGMAVSRSYTVVPPSLSPEKQDDQVEKGQVFYLMIKLYFDGAFTQVIAKLKEGDTVQVSNYEGSFERSKLEGCRHLVMCAAGTGFTPMAGLIHEASTVNSEIDLHLMFFNKTEKDILWRDELEQFSSKFSKLHVEHILSNPDDNWKGKCGRIRKDLLGDFVSGLEKEKSLFCACGPVPFTKEALRLAKEIGFSEEMLHAFLG